MSTSEVSESPPSPPNAADNVESYKFWITRQSREYQKHHFLPQNYRYKTKQDFRTRRCYDHCKGCMKALRIRFGTRDEIGALMKLTNTYALIGGEQLSESLCRTIEGDLPRIPVINTSLAGCKIIGRMCVGNKYGLLLPEMTYNTELRQLKEDLPDDIKVHKVEEKLSALGNVIACNDRVALVHPDLDRETEEIIGDTLQVEVFRHLIGENALVGSYCVFTNRGGLIGADINNRDLENLSSLLELPLVVGTVNRGNKDVGSGLVVNDSIAYVGMETTATEFCTLESAFRLCKGHFNPW